MATTTQNKAIPSGIMKGSLNLNVTIARIKLNIMTADANNMPCPISFSKFIQLYFIHPPPILLRD